jgi:hypothetical protein
LQPIIHFNISTNTFFAIHEFFAADTGKEEVGLGNLLGLISSTAKEKSKGMIQYHQSCESSTTHWVNTKSRSASHGLPYLALIMSSSLFNIDGAMSGQFAVNFLPSSRVPIHISRSMLAKYVIYIAGF